MYIGTVCQDWELLKGKEIDLPSHTSRKFLDDPSLQEADRLYRDERAADLLQEADRLVRQLGSGALISDPDTAE